MPALHKLFVRGMFMLELYLGCGQSCDNFEVNFDCMCCSHSGAKEANSIFCASYMPDRSLDGWVGCSRSLTAGISTFGCQMRTTATQADLKNSHVCLISSLGLVRAALLFIYLLAF